MRRRRYEEVVPIVVRLPIQLRQRLHAVALSLGLSDVEAVRLAIIAFVENKALHAVIREFSSANYRRRRRMGK